MPVFFAYRNFDLGPTGKCLRRFEDDTILDWFRNRWQELAIEDRAQRDERMERILGCDCGYLWAPFDDAAEGHPPPQSDAELLQLLEHHLEPDRVLGSAHVLQVMTEDDGEGGALFYFDEVFLKQSGGLAAYLLQADWQLPTGHAEGPFVPTVQTDDRLAGGDGDGATFFVHLEKESKYPLDDLSPACRIPGVRLPELARYVCCLPPDNDEWEGPGHLRYLPALMFSGLTMSDPTEAALLHSVLTTPGDALNWGAWSDWRQERGGEPPGISLLRRALEGLARLPAWLHQQIPTDTNPVIAVRRMTEMMERHQWRSMVHSLVHVEEHLAQICLDGSDTEVPYFDQWIFFDDLWASAHPDMANALLRFSCRWDVLTPD